MEITMRHLSLILLLAAAPAFAESEYREGANWVRFTANPCTDEKVLAHIMPDYRGDFRAARGEFKGVSHAACWRPHFDKQVIRVIYDDGDSDLLPFHVLKPVTEV